MSAARNVSAWNVLSVTPNCLRLVRYVVVAAERASITPSAWLAADDPGEVDASWR